MGRLQNIRGTSYLSLPAALVRAKGWRKGNEILVLGDRKTKEVYLKKVR